MAEISYASAMPEGVTDIAPAVGTLKKGLTVLSSILLVLLHFINIREDWVVLGLNFLKNVTFAYNSGNFICVVTSLDLRHYDL